MIKFYEAIGDIATLNGKSPFMAIYELYSKNKRALALAENDVFSYDKIPQTLRSQLKQFFNEASENHEKGASWSTYLRVNTADFESFVKIFRREYGVDKLADVKYPNNSCRHELLEFIDSCSTDNFLDCVQVYGSFINDSLLSAQYAKNNYIIEINHRFKEAGLGYEFIDKQIIRIDSKVLHNKVLMPTIAILSSNKIFSGAEDEIRDAFDKFKNGDNKGAVVDAAKAFESTMKAILNKRKWTYNATDSASKLIEACVDNKLFPIYMTTHLNALASMLKSGVPTVRNRTAGHGQGTEITELADHFSSYVLYTALANMKLIIDCDNDLFDEC